MQRDLQQNMNRPNKMETAMRIALVLAVLASTSADWSTGEVQPRLDNATSTDWSADGVSALLQNATSGNWSSDEIPPSLDNATSVDWSTDDILLDNATSANWTCDDILLQNETSANCTSNDTLSLCDEPRWIDGVVPKLCYGNTLFLGSYMWSYNSRKFVAFRGIPYALPPVSELRFRNPVPAQLPSGDLDATKDGPICIQKNAWAPNKPIVGQEDCLYLNVYTHAKSVLLPVMVYIHGGGWHSGSGNSDLVNPMFLMDRDIVLVTFNYRLGALGFLSIRDEEAPGNLALKDQVVVLEWVRDHVRAFGGDPRKVTIFGHDAGAASVHLHMMAPMSAGLFHRAISQSGTARAAWAIPRDYPERLAKRHAALVGCVPSHSTTPEQGVACLRNVDATLLVKTTDKLKKWAVDFMPLYRPTDEMPVDAGERFMSFNPLNPSQTSFNEVPWLTGVVGNEGIVRAVPILTNAKLLHKLNKRQDELMPVLLELGGGKSNKKKKLWHRIRRFYFRRDDWVEINDGNSKAFIKIFSDRTYFHPLHTAQKYHRKAGHKQIYLYSFEYRGKYSYTNVFGNTTKNYGVSHGDDLLYLLPAPLLFRPFPLNSDDWAAVEALVTLWTGFAKYGYPTVPTPAWRSSRPRGECVTKLEDIYWPDSTKDKYAAYLQITHNSPFNPEKGVLWFCVGDSFQKTRMEFWNSLPILGNVRRR